MGSNGCGKLHGHTHLQQAQTNSSKQFEKFHCKFAHQFVMLVSHTKTEYEQKPK